MYVLTVALWDCGHGEGQHQLGQGERSFKVLFSRLHEQTWLATHHWLSDSQLCSRSLRLVWETINQEIFQTNPDTFTIDTSGNQTDNPPLHKLGKSPNPLPEGSIARCGPAFRLGAKRHWCRRSKYYICPAPLHQPPNYPLRLGCHTLALQGT